LINQVAEQAGSDELGGPLPQALADRLRINRGEARRRVAEAADLGPRRALTGEVLPPLLTATAVAQRAGSVDPAHVAVGQQTTHRQRPSGCPAKCPAHRPTSSGPLD